MAQPHKKSASHDTNAYAGFGEAQSVIFSAALALGAGTGTIVLAFNAASDGDWKKGLYALGCAFLAAGASVSTVRQMRNVMKISQNGQGTSSEPEKPKHHTTGNVTFIGQEREDHSPD